MDEHTKAELREMAYDHGASVPRGARKRDVARIVALERNARFIRGQRAFADIGWDDWVHYDGRWWQVTGVDSSGAEVDISRDGRTLTVNTALRGPAVVFDRDDNRVGTIDTMRASRLP